MVPEHAVLRGSGSSGPVFRGCRLSGGVDEFGTRAPFQPQSCLFTLKFNEEFAAMQGPGPRCRGAGVSEGLP